MSEKRPAGVNRIAVEGAVPVECPHGYDACPECDWDGEGERPTAIYRDGFNPAPPPAVAGRDAGEETPYEIGLRIVKAGEALRRRDSVDCILLVTEAILADRRNALAAERVRADRLRAALVEYRSPIYGRGGGEQFRGRSFADCHWCGHVTEFDYDRSTKLENDVQASLQELDHNPECVARAALAEGGA